SLLRAVSGLTPLPTVGGAGSFPLAAVRLAAAPRPQRPPVSEAGGVRVRAGLDREHGARRVEQDPLRVRAEDELADRGPAPQTDDDEVGARLDREIGRASCRGR